jgi:hypothetical protein
LDLPRRQAGGKLHPAVISLASRTLGRKRIIDDATNRVVLQ